MARIGTHLFHFMEYVEGFRGWGRGLRQAVASWYTARPADELAYQAVKYQQRDGWSHRDALRLAHPQPVTPFRTAFRILLSSAARAGKRSWSTRLDWVSDISEAAPRPKPRAASDRL